jgi:hypothetical protein
MSQFRLSTRSIRVVALPLFAVAIAACGSSWPSALSPTSSLPASASPSSAPSAAAENPTPVAVVTAPPDSGAMQIRFTNLTDGGSVAVTNEKGLTVVHVKVEVTGLAPLDVTLQANGLPALDVTGHAVEALNKGGAAPFTGDLGWVPNDGGGDYTLVVTAMTENKDFATATVHVTVTGTPHLTLPPIPTEDQARAKFVKMVQDQYHVTIPKPSMQRFEAPSIPKRGRWIADAYYKGYRYYLSMFDDGHTEWANGPYSDPAHRGSDSFWCRPTGSFKVLVVFVDYGNTGIIRSDAEAKVGVVVPWLNGLYDGFATSHGSSSGLMHVTADTGWVPSPPTKDALLTAAQIKTLTGKNRADYDFVMQIDLDKAGGWGVKDAPGVMDVGGGFALNGCQTAGKFGPISVWSSVDGPGNLQGALVMDFNHELSHLFGMMDDYPYKQDTIGVDGNPSPDWIPYVQFGWTDADGDGIPEIVDPTPYGTSGPKP